MTTAKLCWHRVTHCDSGLHLNPLMHLFMMITLVFSVAFLWFGNTASVQASVLYQQTEHHFVNIWGGIGLLVVTLNYLGLMIRGKVGINLMRLCWFGGFYLWLQAALVYWEGHFLFQLLVNAVPNLLFWVWYTWQWGRRNAHRGDCNYSAFV